MIKSLPNTSFISKKASLKNLFLVSILVFTSTVFGQKKLKTETSCSKTTVTPDTEIKVTTNISCTEAKSLTNFQTSVETQDGFTHVSSIIKSVKSSKTYTGTCKTENGINVISFGTLPDLQANDSYILETTYKSNLYTKDGDVISPDCSRTITTTVIAKCDDLEEKSSTTSSCTFNTRPAITLGSYLSPTSCNGTDGYININGLLKNTSYKVTYTKNGAILSTTISSDASGIIKLGSLAFGEYTDIFVTLGTVVSNKISSSIKLINPVLKTITKGTYTSPTSCISNDGKILFNNFNNSTNYTFYYTRNGSKTNTQLTSNASGVITLNGLADGEFTEFYASLNGCNTNAISDKIVLTVPTLKTISKGTFTSPTTCSSKDGSININGLNNSTTYAVSYTKNGVATLGNFTSNSSGVLTITGLVAAEYSAIYVTLNGCKSNTLTDKITLVNPTAPSITKGTVTSPSACTTYDGSIQVNGLNKSTSYGITYSKNGVTSSASGSTNTSGVLTINALEAGEYSNIYVNLNGCLSNLITDKITLSNPIVPTITKGNVSNLTSCTSKDGSIEINGLGNSISYSLNYKKGDVAQKNDLTASTTGILKLTNLDVADYSSFFVTYKGCNSNVLEDVITIKHPISLTIALDNTNSTSDCTLKDGLIQLNGLAVNTTYSCKYTKNNVNSSIIATSNEIGILTIPNLEAGDYTNIYVAINGCVSNTLTDKINVSTPIEPVFTINSSTSPTLCNGTDGSISFTTNRPNTDHVIYFTKNGVASYVNVKSIDTKLDLNNLSAGEYSNFYVNVNGCLSNTNNSKLNLTDPISNTIAFVSSSNPTSCTNEDGKIAISGLNNNTVYKITYTKNGNNYASDINSNANGNLEITNLSAGNYSNISSELKGCKSNLLTNVISLIEPSAPILAKESTTSPSGCGISDGAIEFSGLNANTEYTLNYQFNGVNSIRKISSSSNGTMALNTLKAGVYENFYIAYKDCQSNIISNKSILVEPIIPTIYLGKLSTPINCTTCKSTLEVKGLELNNSYSIYYKRNNEIETREISSDNSGNAFMSNLSDGIYTEFYIKKYECNSNVIYDKITVQEVKTESNTSSSCKNILVNIEDNGIKNVSCSGLSDGSVTFTISNGSSNNLYRIRKKNFNGTYSVVTFPAYSPSGNLENETKTITFNGLGIGEYDLYAFCNENPNMFNTKYFTIGKDVCTGPISYECTSLNITLNKSDIVPASCKSDNDGSVLFTVSGGFPNNLYRIRKKNNDGTFTTITSPAFKQVGNISNEIKEIKVNNLSLGEYDLYVYCANDANSYKSLTFSITKAKCSLVTDELIAYFPFNGNAKDESGNNHTAIVNCVDLTMDNYNDPKGAYHLNGLYNNITVKDVIDINTVKGYTLSLWYKLNELPTEDASSILSIPNNANNNSQTEFAIDKDGAIRYNFGNGINTQALRSNEIAYTKQWNHIVLTHDQTTNNLFHNGKLVVSSPAYALSNNLKDIVLGYIGSSNTANVSVDELRVYTRSITETEVQTIYTNEAVENCAGIRLSIDATSQAKTLKFTVMNGSANNKYRLRKRNANGVFVSVYTPTYLSLNNQIGETKSLTITNLEDGTYDIYAYCGSDGTKYQGYQFTITNGAKMIQTVTTPEGTTKFVEDKGLTEASAGIENISSTIDSKFTIYPNPTDNFVYISAEEGEIIKFIRVYSSNGQMIYEGNHAEDHLEKTINVSSWSAGNYIVEIFLVNKPSVRKNFVLE
jgi:hypothetical protein